MQGACTLVKGHYCPSKPDRRHEGFALPLGLDAAPATTLTRLDRAIAVSVG